MTYVYLPQRATGGKQWVVEQYDLDSNSPPLKNIFLEYLLVEEVHRDDLDDLDELIEEMDIQFENREEEYTQATINKFNILSKAALRDVKDINLGHILNKQPYDSRVIEEQKKIKDLNKETQKLTPEQLDEKLKALETKFKDPFDWVRVFTVKTQQGANLADIFPYDIDEVGQVTERQILDKLGNVIGQEEHMKIKDILVPAKREKRTGALTAEIREKQDKLFNYMKGFKNLDNKETQELREKLGKKEGEPLYHYEIYQALKNKVNFLDMPIDKEVVRFKTEGEILTGGEDAPILKWQKKKWPFKFKMILEHLPAEDEDSKLNFLKDIKINIDEKSVKGKRKSTTKTKRNIKIKPDSFLIEMLKTGRFGNVVTNKKGEIITQEPTEVLTETDKIEMAKSIIKDVNFDMILPEDSLNPFLLADVIWNFEINLYPLIKNFEMEKEKPIELKLIWETESNWETEYYVPRTGEKFSPKAVMMGGQVKTKEGSVEPLVWQQGEFTQDQIDKKLPKITKTGREVRVGDIKEWGDEKVKMGGYGKSEIDREYLDTLAYPMDLPKEHKYYDERGNSPNLGDDQYPLHFYNKAGETIDVGKDVKEQKEEKAKQQSFKQKSGIQTKKIAYKIHRYFNEIEKRLKDLSTAVKNIPKHTPEEFEEATR